jgi:hypothetical protein
VDVGDACHRLGDERFIVSAFDDEAAFSCG